MVHAEGSLRCADWVCISLRFVLQPAGSSYPSSLSCETLATWSQQQWPSPAPQSEGLKLISTIRYTLGFDCEKSHKIVTVWKIGTYWTGRYVIKYLHDARKRQFCNLREKESPAGVMSQEFPRIARFVVGSEERVKWWWMGRAANAPRWHPWRLSLPCAEQSWATAGWLPQRTAFVHRNHRRGPGLCALGLNFLRPYVAS